MPKKIENKLKKRAASMAKKGKLHKVKGESTTEAKNAYIYGTLNKLKTQYGIR